MAEYIKGKTANDVWKTATNMLLKREESLGSRNGNMQELLHTFITIEEPRQKWVYDRIPPMSIAFALAELVWIMNGDDRSDIINFWNPSLPKYAGYNATYYGAYGKRIRSHFGFDQLKQSYFALQNAPESRQVVIQIYDTVKDFPINNGIPQDADIPCNICSLLKVRNNKLEWSQIMRSNDILLGMPYNFVQFTSLQEILAGWLELDVGSYNHYSDSLHLYCRDTNKIKIGHEIRVENPDSFSLCRDESERIFKELYERMIALKNNTSENLIFSLAHLESKYTAYNNIMLIIAAYVAKKKDNNALANELINRCSNYTYKTMWESWKK